jgi:hypothetical protein
MPPEVVEALIPDYDEQAAPFIPPEPSNGDT